MSKSIQFDFTRELGDPHAGIGKKQVKILEKQDIQQDKRFESRTKGSKAVHMGGLCLPPNGELRWAVNTDFKNRPNY